MHGWAAIVNTPEFKTVFLGDGPFRKEAEEVGKVTGWVKRPADYLNKSRLCFASGYLTILEALALKKPVFAFYNDPVKKDYLKITPFSKWINIENNIERMAKKLVNYKEDRQRLNEASKCALQQTWKKVAETYMKLWEVDSEN